MWLKRMAIGVAVVAAFLLGLWIGGRAPDGDAHLSDGEAAEVAVVETNVLVEHGIRESIGVVVGRDGVIPVGVHQ